MTKLTQVTTRLSQKASVLDTQVASSLPWVSMMTLALKPCTDNSCRLVKVVESAQGEAHAIWKVTEFGVFTGFSNIVEKDHITPVLKLLRTHKLDLKAVNLGVKLYVVVSTDSESADLELLLKE